MHAYRGRLHIEPILWNVRLAYAGQIGSNHGELVGESGNQRPPHPRGLRVAMQKNDRRAVPCDEVMDLNAVDSRELRFDRAASGLCLRCCWKDRGREDGENNGCCPLKSCPHRDASVKGMVIDAWRRPCNSRLYSPESGLSIASGYRL